jgi:hypothetical protein
MILNMVSSTRYDIIICYVKKIITMSQININTLKNNKLEF